MNMESESEYLISFDSESINIDKYMECIYLEHCKNCFEVTKIKNGNNEFKIVRVLKNGFGKFSVNDIIQTCCGMVSINNMSNANIDVNDIIFFSKNKIIFE